MCYQVIIDIVSCHSDSNEMVYKLRNPVFGVSDQVRLNLCDCGVFIIIMTSLRVTHM